MEWKVAKLMVCECGENFAKTFLKYVMTFQKVIKFHLLCTGDDNFRKRYETRSKYPHREATLNAV